MITRNVLPSDGSGAVFRLVFTPRHGVELLLLPEEEVQEMERQTGRYGGMLTDEYVRWRTAR